MLVAFEDPPLDNRTVSGKKNSLPDGWEWKYGLNPLSATVGDDGQTGDPDGDQLTNLQGMIYLKE